LDDLLIILVLGILGLAAGWWSLPEARRSMEQRIDWPRIRGFVQASLHHRDTQVFVATFLWIATFWMAMLSAHGLDAAKRVVNPPTPPAREGGRHPELPVVRDVGKPGHTSSTIG
jgi:hypothetical protein